MCDTLYLPRTGRASGVSCFAKNSDRNPDEPQVMVLSGSGESACFLSRPVWMHGAEMGINARGIVIGNEAVFSRKKADPKGMLGMDILRTTLEQAGTAAEAVKLIARSVETGSQGGNGAYKGTLVYNNSYLAADAQEAWIIETAGHRWAAKRMAGPAAISNTYSLKDDFDSADAQTLAEKGPGYSWKRRIESPLYRLITSGDIRRACSLGNLAGMDDGVGPVFAAMRSHGGYSLARPNLRNMTSVCMHEGGLVNNSTTASMVVELRSAPLTSVIWYTASPAPCLSVYKPAVLEAGGFKPLWTEYDYAEGSSGSTDYWNARRALTARLQHTAFRDPAFAERRDAAQSALIELMSCRKNAAADEALASEVNRIVRDFEESSASR
jgi:dipeptidase